MQITKLLHYFMKNIFVALMCVFSIVACAQSGKFKLTVTIPEGYECQKCYIHWFDGVENDYVDSVKVVNGKAVWTYNMTAPAYGQVTMVPVEKVRAKRVAMYFVPGEECYIKPEGKKYVVNGTKFYEEFAAFDSFMEQFTTDVDEAKVVEYIKQHATEEGIVASTFYLSMDTYLNNAKPTDRMKKLITTMLDREKKEQEAEEAKQNAMVGQPAPDFSLEDLNGKQLALSSLKGKYVVLDFWGSWCVWCMRGVPKMKEYYSKYASKMEILGVDCGDTKDKWKACVKDNSIPWLHVYNPKGSGIEQKYNIEGYPTKIVIDPKGNIVKVIVGEDPAFYTYLDELLGAK